MKNEVIFKIIFTDMKYRLTDETIKVGEVILHRIECVEAFANVKVGDKGGWIEKESNLSQTDNAWVYGDAQVFGCAEVYGNAEVYGHAEVKGNAQVSGNAQVKGNAKVSGNAQVYGNAKVYDGAYVSGNAQVYGNAAVHGYVIVNGFAEVKGNAEISKISDYIVFKNSFSSGRYFTWTKSNNMWTVGCFHGTGEELIEKARQDSEEKARLYALYVKLVEDLQKVNDANPSI